MKLISITWFSISLLFKIDPKADIAGNYALCLKPLFLTDVELFSGLSLLAQVSFVRELLWQSVTITGIRYMSLTDPY